MATSQNQEPGTNGFHDGDPLSERMKKYQIDDNEEKTSTGRKPSEEFNQPLAFKDEAERLKHLHKIRASPASSAASRISKNKTRSYELLNFTNGTQTYDSLRGG